MYMQPVSDNSAGSNLIKEVMKLNLKVYLCLKREMSSEFTYTVYKHKS